MGVAPRDLRVWPLEALVRCKKAPRHPLGTLNNVWGFLEPPVMAVLLIIIGGIYVSQKAHTLSSNPQTLGKSIKYDDITKQESVRSDAIRQTQTKT